NSSSSRRIRMPEIKGFRVRVVLALILSQIIYLPPTFQSRERRQAASSLTEEQKIVHVLNRAGFGPRPGDVEKVRRMGIQKYLELQLHPLQIDDSAAESKLLGLKTLTMSSSELIEQYPPRIQRKPTNGERISDEGQTKRGDESDEMERPKTMALN